MLTNVLNYLAYLPKKLIALATIAVLVLVPVQAALADSVQIEADLGVANSTAGQSTYAKSTNAMVDDIVKFEVWYHNKEEENSGKVAQNLKIKANLPQNVPGKVQNVTATVSADNSNTVNSAATVNLSLDNAYLEFIPGSVYWRHNTGTNAAPNWVTQQITDAVVTGAGGAVIENEQPCFNFAATVTFLARVKAKEVSIVKQVRKTGETTWVTENTAKVGEELEYQIKIKNEGNVQLDHMIIADNLPGPMQYVPNSTKIKNSNHPNGDAVESNNITTGGVDFGSLAPGGATYVLFKVKVTDKNLNCGENKLVNVGITRELNANKEFYNTAITRVSKQCQPPQTPPQTPPTQELPNTGIEGPLAGIFGSGSLGIAIRSYVRGRRSLKDALLNV